MESVPDMDDILNALEASEYATPRGDGGQLRKAEENDAIPLFSKKQLVEREEEEEVIADEKEEKEEEKVDENGIDEVNGGGGGDEEVAVEEAVHEAAREEAMEEPVVEADEQVADCASSSPPPPVEDNVEEKKAIEENHSITEDEDSAPMVNFESAVSEMEKYLLECEADSLLLQTEHEHGESQRGEVETSDGLQQMASVEDASSDAMDHVQMREEQEEEEESLSQAQNDSEEPTIAVVDVVNDSEDAVVSVDAETEEGEIAPGDALVISTHDPCVSPAPARLTESERQLGKARPHWIPDSECDCCMLCELRWGLLIRRHHCRACGRVICHQCSTHRVHLPYMAGEKKKHGERICTACNETLQRIARLEEDEQSRVMDDTPGSSSTAGEASRTKSAIKVKANDESASSSHKRSVTFLDGVNPGDVDETAGDADSREPTHKTKKRGSKRALVSRRVLELRMEEERTPLLPPLDSLDDTSPLWLRSPSGHLESITHASACERLQTEALHIAIKRNLHVVVQICNNESRVCCISTRGMNAIGLDEILIAFHLLDDEQPWIPLDLLRVLDRLFLTALDSRNETSGDEKVGIRRVAMRLDPLVHCAGITGGRIVRPPHVAALLLFRPSVQFLGDLPVPRDPYLVAAFVAESEVVWATALPNRLLYRLGLQSSFYPTPIVNERDRSAVFGAVGHMTVMKVFTDFRNWSYRMMRIPGSTVALIDDETVIDMPVCALDQIRALIEANRNMIGWAVDFNGDCDSHLVCDQPDNGGAYRTQVISIRGKTRRVTGATFVIVDGALKTVDCRVQANIVEDGVAIRLRPDSMTEFMDCLFHARPFTLESQAMTLRLKWSTHNAMAPLSPIDNRSLAGCWQYGMTLSRLLTSAHAIPGASEWALRLCSVMNVDEHTRRLTSSMETKVFSVCEQVAAQVARSLAPFVQSLVANHIMSLSIRIHLTSETAEYETSQWSAMHDEHALWMASLDDQLVPALFNLCSYISNGFHVELQLALISTRPLPI